jgi:hypothetical protein
MNSAKKTIITALIIIIFYLIAINLLFMFKESSNSLEPNNTVSGLNTKISVSSSLSVLVVGNRWYGKIVTENNIQSLYLFNLIKIPWKYYNLNFVWIHLFFAIILTEILILLNQKWRKGGVKNESIMEIPIDSAN